MCVRARRVRFVTAPEWFSGDYSSSTQELYDKPALLIYEFNCFVQRLGFVCEVCVYIMRCAMLCRSESHNKRVNVRGIILYIHSFRMKEICFQLRSVMWDIWGTSICVKIMCVGYVLCVCSSVGMVEMVQSDGWVCAIGGNAARKSCVLRWFELNRDIIRQST